MKIYSDIEYYGPDNRENNLVKRKTFNYYEEKEIFLYRLSLRKNHDIKPISIIKYIINCNLINILLINKKNIDYNVNNQIFKFITLRFEKINNGVTVFKSDKNFDNALQIDNYINNTCFSNISNGYIDSDLIIDFVIKFELSNVNKYLITYSSNYLLSKLKGCGRYKLTNRSLEFFMNGNNDEFINDYMKSLSQDVYGVIPKENILNIAGIYRNIALQRSGNIKKLLSVKKINIIHNQISSANGTRYISKFDSVTKTTKNFTTYDVFMELNSAFFSILDSRVHEGIYSYNLKCSRLQNPDLNRIQRDLISSASSVINYKIFFYDKIHFYIILKPNGVDSFTIPYLPEIAKYPYNDRYAVVALKEKENDGVITAINKINVNLSLSCSRNTTYKIYKNSFSDNFFYASKPPSKSHLLSKRYNFKFRIAIIDLETKTIKYISNYFFVRYNSEYSPFCIY